MNDIHQHIVKRAAQDLETIGGIMVVLGLHVGPDDIHEEQMEWFGRQIEAISEQLDKVLAEDC